MVGKEATLYPALARNPIHAALDQRHVKADETMRQKWNSRCDANLRLGGHVDSQTLTILMVAAAVILVGIAAWAYMSRQRTHQLRERFGPEYDRTVRAARTPAEAETELSKRAHRVERFKLHPLSREQADSFADQWRRIQA